MPVAFAIWRLLRLLTSLVEESLRLSGAFPEDRVSALEMPFDYVDAPSKEESVVFDENSEPEPQLEGIVLDLT